MSRGDNGIAANSTTVPPEELSRLRGRAVALCVVTTMLVAAIELLIGWRYGLLSLVAEGMHTAADLADSLLAAILVAKASRPADQEHPYGHGKFDTVAGLLEGTFVGLAALWAIYNAGQVLLGVEQPDPRPAIETVVAMVLASMLYLGVSTYVLRIAKRTQSPAVRAEGLHLRTHVYIAAGLVAGLLLSRVGIERGWAYAQRIDSLVTLALGVYLVSVAYRIMAPAFRQLVDSALPREEMRRIWRMLEEFRAEYVEVHAVRARRSGTEAHIDIHLMVLPDTTVEAAHELSHRIEQHLAAQVGDTHMLIHVEPADEAAMRAYETRGRVGDVVRSVGEHAEREALHHGSNEKP